MLQILQLVTELNHKFMQEKKKLISLQKSEMTAGKNMNFGT